MVALNFLRHLCPRQVACKRVAAALTPTKRRRADIARATLCSNTTCRRVVVSMDLTRDPRQARVI